MAREGKKRQGKRHAAKAKGSRQKSNQPTSKGEREQAKPHRWRGGATSRKRAQHHPESHIADEIAGEVGSGTQRRRGINEKNTTSGSGKIIKGAKGGGREKGAWEDGSSRQIETRKGRASRNLAGIREYREGKAEYAY